MKYIDNDLAQMLTLSLDHLLPTKVEAWKKDLAQGRRSREARDVFVGIGWLSSARDSRLHDDPVDVDHDAGGADATPNAITTSRT